jgi:uncharacterized protein (TIGR00725 family)
MNVAVIGGSQCSQKAYSVAERLGELLAQEGWTVVCGGKSGVMEAVCKGAQEKGGRTVGILPEKDCSGANAFVEVKLPTGIGYARNVFVVRSAEHVIAIDGEYGTLSEIAFALSEGKTVYGIDTWDIEGVIHVPTPEDAIAAIQAQSKT